MTFHNQEHPENFPLVYFLKIIIIKEILAEELCVKNVS
jgi:hypothetical protein